MLTLLLYFAYLLTAYTLGNGCVVSKSQWNKEKVKVVWKLTIDDPLWLTGQSAALSSDLSNDLSVEGQGRLFKYFYIALNSIYGMVCVVVSSYYVFLLTCKFLFYR